MIMVTLSAVNKESIAQHGYRSERRHQSANFEAASEITFTINFIRFFFHRKRLYPKYRNFYLYLDSLKEFHSILSDFKAR